MHPVRAFGQRTFASLSVRNYRLFFIGQGISQCGSWMQSIAQGLLVLELTGSGTALGLVIALQNLPVLFFGPWGGVMADRFPKRTILYVTQALSGLLALTVGTLVITDLIQLWMLYVLGLMLGFITVFDNPARQTFVREMVGNERLTNAVSLSSMEFNLARVIGPSIAGALIATVGLAVCFYVNAASYLFVVAGLALMRVSPVERPAPSPALGALKEGFGYIFGNPGPRALVILIAVFSVFGFSFVTMMPVFARDVLHLEAGGYGALVSAVGVGAAAAALGAAAFGRRLGGAGIGRTWVLFGVLLAAGAFAPTFVSALVIFTLTGCTMALNSILANTQLQIQAPDELRGRVMGFYSFVVLGMAPFGSLQAGWVAEHLGVRAAFGIGGGICLVAAGVIGRKGRKVGRAEGRVEPVAPAPAAEPEPTPVAARTVSELVPEQGPTPGE